jgi:hypothetical protein
MGSEQLCEVMTSEYAIEYIGYILQSLSAFRVDDLCTSVRTALTDFADNLLRLGESCYGRVEAARRDVYGFDIISQEYTQPLSYSADLHMFAQETAQRIADDEFRSAAENVMKALEEARISIGVCTRDTFYDDIYGLVVFWPDLPVLLDEYKTERLSLDTTWDEFLLAFYAE